MTIGGAALAALLLAPRALPATAAVVALAASLFARRPLARHEHEDALFLTLLGALAASCIGLLAAEPPVAFAVAVCAVAVVVAEPIVRRYRLQRAGWFEAGGLFVLGGAAGVAAYAGGLPFAPSAALGLTLGTHAAAGVPLVRAHVRRRERQARQPLQVAALGVFTATAVVGALGEPLVALALAPRAFGLGLALAQTIREPLSPTRLGVRETIALTVCIALVITAISA